MDAVRYMNLSQKLKKLGYDVKSNYDDGGFSLEIKQTILKVGGFETIGGVENELEKFLKQQIRIKKLKKII